jgi:predicted nucleic acid-binding protein
MTVVADASPIIIFARSGHEDLLRQVFSQLIIPEAVYHEVVIKGRGKPGISLVVESPWIVRETVQDVDRVNLLPGNLGLGEREAIILAEDHNAALLTDDRAARREANKRGIIYLGCLRVLQEAKTAGFIETVTPITRDLRQAGLHLSNALYQEFLQDMGE